MASFGLRVTRTLFDVADHIAPSLAGRIAFRLFTRTKKPTRLSAREREVLATTADFMATARHHRLAMGRRCIAAYEFRPKTVFPAARTVLVVHGWHSRTEHMRGVIEALLEQGFRVVAIDLPGHGNSTGRMLHLAKAVEAASLAAQWFGPFAAIVGHSFGGAVAVNAAVGSIAGVAPVAADRLVLIAAPSSMPAIFDDFSRFLNLGPRAQTALAGEVLRIAGRPLSTYVGAEQIETMPIPTLVIHAPDDREVSFEAAKAFERAGAHVALMEAPGLGHRRILADQRVAAAAAAFAADISRVLEFPGAEEGESQALPAAA